MSPSGRSVGPIHHFTPAVARMPEDGLHAAIALIDKSIGVVPRHGFLLKHPANPLFDQDEPWEPRIDNGYPNALYDKERNVFELFYGTCQENCATQLLLFANSTDGLQWSKPALNLFDIGRIRPDLKSIGKRNNVLLEGGGIGVMRDAGRYVAFGPGCYSRSSASRGCAMEWGTHKAGAGYPHEDLAFSLDGFHWENASGVGWPQPQRWDCHNNLLRDGNRWLATTRLGFYEPPGRAIAIASSIPSEGLRFDVAEAPHRAFEGTLDHQLYSQLTFKWLDIYLGLVMVYDANTESQQVHCRLAWSRSASDWWQWVEGADGLTGRDLIPLGGRGEFDSHICFGSKPLLMANEERIYYMGGNGPHSGARNSSFGLATLRKHGFAGLSAWEGKGTVTTLPLLVTGSSLIVSADFNPRRVRVQAPNRVRIGVVDGPSGLSLSMAIPMMSNVTAAPVTWRSGATFASLLGRTVRMEMAMTGAMVYAVGFAK